MAEQTNNASRISEKSQLFGYLQLIIIAGLIVIALVLARAPAKIERDSGLNQSTSGSHSPLVSVIREIPTESFVLPVHLTGNVTLEERVTVSSQARGKVIWVSDKFRAGKTVPANEVIVRIDPTEYQLRVKEAQSRLSLANLSQTDPQPSSESDRLRHLAQIELLETQLELAKRDLIHTEISLPYELRVIGTDVEVGELVGPHEYVGQDASVLGIGYRPQALEVSAPIEPYNLTELNPLIGAAATVTVGQNSYRAVLDRVSSVVVPKTRLITIFLKFEDHAQQRLPLPGMFAEITLNGPEFPESFVLPLEAMQTSSTVWVVENNTLSARTPQSEALTDSQWIVAPFDIADGLVIGNYANAVVGAEVQPIPVD